jgi:hypothetical protein
MSRELADLPGVALAIGDLARTWERRPWVVGLAGTPAGRAAVLNLVFANAVLDAGDRAGECATVRVRRGRETRFEAKRRDGTTETHALAVRPRDPEAGAARIAAARAEHQRREVALDHLSAGLPRWLATPLRGWRVLLWPIAWVLRRRHRAALDALAVAARDAAASGAELATAEADVADREAELRVGRTRYFESLRALSASSSVLEVVVELADGPLPEDVELVERTPGVLLDAMIELDREALVAGGFTLGEPATAVPALSAMLADARALRIARHVLDVAISAIAKLDEQIEAAQAGFVARIAHLEGLRIADRIGFREVQLARIRPQLFASVHAVIEHASVHLGGELAQLGSDWIGAIAAATTSDELKDVTATIETTGAANAHRIADETRILVTGGAAGSAHDLIPDVLAALLPYGLPDAYVRARREAPRPPPLELLPSLAQATDTKLSGSAFANLFRTFDTRRSDVRAKVHARIEHLREVAAAELLDVEPQLVAAIEAALVTALADGLDAHAKWLDESIAAERASIEAARRELAPVIARRDRARHELAELATTITAFETSHPATAAAAAAATS